MSNQPLEVNSRQYRIILASLVIFFLFYNAIIYTRGTESELPPMGEEAIRGEILWQENNCTACHQLYGLGGQLGPDLTNIISRQGKGPVYVKAFVNSGVKAMPLFNFTEEEKDKIVAFLTYVDKTGIYPNSNAKLTKSGWVELEYKPVTPDENE